MAFIFAIPMLLYVSSPVLHAVGLHEMASAGDNMNAADDGQEAAMESTAAAAAAAAAAAGAGSGSENSRGNEPDDPLDGVTLTPEKSGWESFKEKAAEAVDIIKEDWESTKEAASKTFGGSEESTEVSPQTPLDSETSKPPTYDTDELGGDSSSSKGSGSRGTSGSDSGSSSGSGSSGSSSGDSSSSSSRSSTPGGNYKDWFGLPDWFP